MTREALHELVDRIPKSEIVAAQRALEYLASDAAFRAAMSAPPDDEPVTAGDADAITTREETSRLAKWFFTRRFPANSESDEVCVTRVRPRGTRGLDRECAMRIPMALIR